MKKRYLFTAAAVLCLAGNMTAEAETVSQEEQAYQDFLSSGEYLSDVKQLGDISYGVYDINQDGIKELILKGLNEGSYEYCFYRYKDDEVKVVGSFQNWQNGGNGELYYTETENSVVVDNRLADHKSYTLYQVNGRIRKGFTIHKQSIDVETTEGTFKRAYEYSKEDENGNTVDETITDADWDAFEAGLAEISFSEVQVSGSREYTEEQIAALGKSLGVPDDVTITRCEVSEPWFWDGAGRWLVSIELYSDDIFLAGAAIDPDTLELQREIAPYDASRVEKEKQEAVLSELNSSDMEVANGLIRILVSGDGSAFLKLLPELPTEYREAFGDKMIAVFTELVQNGADEAVQEFQEKIKDSQIFYQALSSEDVDSETLADLQKSYAEFGYYVTAARLVHEELSEDGATSYMDIPVVEIDGKWYLDLESWEDDDDSDDDEDFEERLEEELTEQPFYGIWCYASKDSDEAENYAETLTPVCDEPEVLLSSDWSNLNPEPYYVVTAGRYETEEEANEALGEVQNVCDGAYVKYSGEYEG